MVEACGIEPTERHHINTGRSICRKRSDVARSRVRNIGRCLTPAPSSRRSVFRARNEQRRAR
jgi:hypothetical protein